MNEPAILAGSHRSIFRFSLGLVVALSPVFLLVLLLAGKTRNIPAGDDYVSILPFLCRWQDTTHLWDKFALLIEQYFSHRIALTRLVALAQLGLAGSVDFRWFCVIGWSGWCGIGAMLAFGVAATRARPWLALPVFLLLMQPQGWTNFLIGMQAVQNIGVIALALGSFIAASGHGRRRATLALALATLAAGTSANGLLVAPTLALLWFVRRERIRGLVATACAALTIAAYFHGFHPESGPFLFPDLLAYAATMAGGFVPLARTALPALIVGSVLLVAGSMAVARPKHWQTNGWLMAFMFFLIVTTLLAARGRLGWGMDYMTQDRYRLYGLLLLASLLVLHLGKAISVRGAWISATLAIGGFTFLSYLSEWSSVCTQDRWREATAINAEFELPLLLSSGPEAKDFVAWLNIAEQRRLYQLPHPLKSEDLDTLRSLGVTFDSGATFTLRESAPYLGYGAEPDRSAVPLSPPRFVLAVSATHRVLLPVDIWRTRLFEIATRRNLLGDRFAIIWPAHAFQSGHYTLYGLERNHHGRLAVIWTGSVDCPPPS